MYIDTHAHLNMDQFKDDYKEVIDRAFKKKFKAIINVGANLKSSRRAVQIAKEYEKGVYATVGVHPTDGNIEIFNEKKLTNLFYSKKVIAVGEIGLDYSGEKVDKEAQEILFRKQIDIAIEAQKPIVLHCRDAYDDLINILKSYNNLPKAVMHCYVGGLEHAKILLEMGLMFSFNGIITFTKDEEQFEVVKFLPLDKIMLETDCPWLAPKTNRGKRNEPSYLIETAQKIAELKGLTLSEVETQTTKNAEEFFGI